MAFHPELIIRFDTADAGSDQAAFEKFFQPSFQVGVYTVAPDRSLAKECKFFVRVFAEGTCEDDIFIDLATSRIEQWLESRNAPSSVDCYDSEGTLLKTISAKPR
jgi:hypothetical protein